MGGFSNRFIAITLISALLVGMISSMGTCVKADEKVSTEEEYDSEQVNKKSSSFNTVLESNEEKKSLDSQIQITSYYDSYDKNNHNMFDISGVEVGDTVTIDYNNSENSYVYGVAEEKIPQISDVGYYPYTISIHRNDDVDDYIFSDIAKIYKDDELIETMSNDETSTLGVDINETGWDGSSIKEPQLIGYEYKINTPEELAWFANEVNNNANTFDGKSICISGDIDLNSKEWIAIGGSNAGDAKEIKGSIIIQDAVVRNFKFSNNNCKHKGLFGSVKIWNMYVDNLKMENVNIFSSSGYDGVLFGKVFIERNGKCEIKNSTFDGYFTGNSECGAIAGYVEGEGDNSIFDVVNCNLKIEATTYNTMWDGSKYNSYSKGGAISKYMSKANGNKLIFNGVDVDVNLEGYNEYGYGSCVVGGLIGEIESNAGVYIYQCSVRGSITSKGYSGYAGGFIGRMVSCSIYKQLDSYVTASICSKFNAYGYEYNAGGFIEGPMQTKPDGYIKNSYFAGSSSTATAFIAKDAVGGDKLKIYNCYYDSSRLSNKVYHANKNCYLIKNTTFDCNSYNTEQMGIQSNFKGWDFDNVWVMGDKYPELRRTNFTLPDDFISDTIGNYDSAIVRTVREYTSQEMYSQWEQIWNSDYSDEVKFNKILELASNYGITDPKEGLEFVVISKEKRWAYNTLISDDLYTATNFLNFLDNGGKALLVADGLIFNSEIKAWLDPGTYAEDDYPGISKYKDMLYEYMDLTSNKIEILDDIKLVAKLSKNVTDATKKVYVDEKIKELEKCNATGIKGEKERWKIINEMVEQGVFFDGKIEDTGGLNLKISYTLDSTSGFGQFAKAMGIAQKTIDITDMAIKDAEDIMLLDSKLQQYYQFQTFLDDIINANNLVPWQLREAAKQVKDEMIYGRWNEILKIAKQVITNCKITSETKKIVEETLGISSIMSAISTLELEAWFINQIVDVGNMTKQASYVEGYAYLEKLYKSRLERSAARFNNSMTEENAWDFYYDYNMLYSLRYNGEKAYLKMQNVKGLAKILFAHGYAEKEEATNQILSMLENKCKFDLGEDIEVPESMKYLSKLIVSCPVDVKVTTEDGQVIAELKDGELQDFSNEYGRFVVVYNYSTRDYQKIVYLNRQNLKVDVISKDDGLVNMTYSYKDQNDNVIVKYMNNLPLLKKETISIKPDIVETQGKVSIVNESEESELQLGNEAPSYTNLDNAVLSDENVSIYIGESRLLKILVEPENASIQDVTWYSSDPDIVRVKDGKIEAIKEGNAIIYAFMHDKEKPLVCNVSSEKIPDTTAPKVNISIGNKAWNSFLEKVTFGIFNKTAKEVSITATDNETPNPHIYYFLSDKELTKEQLTDEHVTWKEYNGKFELSQGSKKIIYAKAIDDAGNMQIVNSEGVVTYIDSISEIGRLTFVKNVSGDLVAKVKLNGNTIKEINNEGYVLKEGIDYIVDNAGNITFKKSYLDTLMVKKDDYTFEISYNPFGESYVVQKDENGIDENDKPNTSTINVYVRKPKLKSIIDPNESVIAENGTAKDSEALGLPTKVAIDTEDSTVTKANVIWNLDNLEDEIYNPLLLEEQSFTLEGTAIIPEEIDTDGTALKTTVNVIVRKAGTVAEPVAKSKEGEYTQNKEISLSTETEGAVIYYTVDGTIPTLVNGNPTGTTQKYTDIIQVSGIQGKKVVTTIKAIAVKNGLFDSNIAEFEYIIKIPHTHGFDKSVWTNDMTHHWHECNVENCDKDAISIKEKALHEFEYSYVWINNNKECTAIRKCRICGYTDSETVDAVITVTQNRSCTLPELTKYTANFKNVFNEQFIEQIIANVKTAEAIGHKEVEDVAVATTCTTAGKTAGSHCSVCNEVLISQKEIPAIGHDFGDWETVKSPNCTDKGSQKRVCKVCGYIETKDVEATGHTWDDDFTVDKEATCTEDGSKSIHCKKCDTTKDSTVIKAHGHTVVEDAAVAATCTTAGKTAGSHCSVCNEVLISQKEIPATGHVASDWIVDKEATIEIVGIKHRECTICSEILETAEIEKLIPSAYEIIVGADSKWIENTDGSLVIKGDGAFSKFVSVKVDGDIIGKENYTVEEGSTIVTLKAEYLKTLAVGKHSFEIVWSDGTAATNFTVVENISDDKKPDTGKADDKKSDKDKDNIPPAVTVPGNKADNKNDAKTDKKVTGTKTGDDNKVGLWLLLMLVSLAGIAGMEARIKRNNKMK